MSFQSSTVKGLVTTGNIGLSLTGKDSAGAIDGFNNKSLTFPEKGIYLCTGILSAIRNPNLEINNKVIEFAQSDANFQPTSNIISMVPTRTDEGDTTTYSVSLTLIVPAEAGYMLTGSLSTEWASADIDRGMFALTAVKMI